MSTFQILFSILMLKLFVNLFNNWLLSNHHIHFAFYCTQHSSKHKWYWTEYMYVWRWSLSWFGRGNFHYRTSRFRQHWSAISLFTEFQWTACVRVKSQGQSNMQIFNAQCLLFLILSKVRLDTGIHLKSIHTLYVGISVFLFC